MGAVILRRDAVPPLLQQQAAAVFPQLAVRDELSAADLAAGYPDLACFAAADAVLELGDQARLLTAAVGGREQEFALDLTEPQLRRRIEHPGSEALCRACLHKVPAGSLIFDATAGLGRDALLLASRGMQVQAFERHQVVYLLLADALRRAAEAGIYSFALPVLHYGMAAQAAAAAPQLQPEVIYFDPMFPPRRKSAQVKKNMQIFHQVVGADADSVDCARQLLSCCRRRLVIKRPAGAEPLNAPGLKAAFAVDGGGCRFDCYLPQSC